MRTNKLLLSGCYVFFLIFSSITLYWIFSRTGKEFEIILGNQYVLHGNNTFDIHISDESEPRNFQKVSESEYRGVIRAPGIINLPEELNYKSSLAVPPKIVLLGRDKEIVYGLNVSIQQIGSPSQGLPSAYFGWFVLDTKDCKCWLGLTEENMMEILNAYGIEKASYEYKWWVL